MQEKTVQFESHDEREEEEEEEEEGGEVDVIKRKQNWWRRRRRRQLKQPFAKDEEEDVEEVHVPPVKHYHCSPFCGSLVSISLSLFATLPLIFCP